MSSDGNGNRFKSFFINDILPRKKMLLRQEMIAANSFDNTRSCSGNRMKTSPAEKREAADGKMTIQYSSSEAGVGDTSSEDACRGLSDDDSPVEVCLMGRTPPDNWSESMSLQSSRTSGQQAAAAAAAAAHITTTLHCTLRQPSPLVGATTSASAKPDG